MAAGNKTPNLIEDTSPSQGNFFFLILTSTAFAASFTPSYRLLPLQPHSPSHTYTQLYSVQISFPQLCAPSGPTQPLPSPVFPTEAPVSLTSLYFLQLCQFWLEMETPVIQSRLVISSASCFITLPPSMPTRKAFVLQDTLPS